MNQQEEWVKGVFNSEDSGEYVGVLHIRSDIHDAIKSGKPVLFAEYATQWLEVFVKPHVATNTYRGYHQELKKHLIPTFGETDIREIETIDIQRFLNERAYLKFETQRKIRGVLNMIFKAAIEDDIIQRNPVQSPRLKYTNQQKTIREPLQVEDMKNIMESIDKIEREEDRRYLAIQMTMALRPCEVLGLRWEDVDLKEGLLHIRRNVVHPYRHAPEVRGLKTKSSYRSVPISKLAWPYLQGEHEAGFIFGGVEPMWANPYRMMWKRIGEQIDLHGATGYIFRHTVLTDLYDATKDVKATQAYAGHALPDITMRRYVHGRNGDLKGLAEVIDGVYDNSSNSSDKEDGGRRR